MAMERVIKNDPYLAYLAKQQKPRNYDVKIIGGKRVLIWEEENKKQAKKTAAAPIKEKEVNSKGRPKSSDSINSTYKTLPPIGSKAPNKGGGAGVGTGNGAGAVRGRGTEAGADGLDSFVSSQLRGVPLSTLEDLSKSLLKLDTGREHGLPPSTIAKLMESERFSLGLAPVTEALLERLPTYSHFFHPQL